MTAASSRQIELWINGERRSVGLGVTLAGLVAELGLEPDRVAIERNREIVRRSVWASVELADKDRLEIVHFVGGG